MPVTANSPAPYTAGVALTTVMRRYREKGLSTPITKDVLLRAGVGETLVPRTYQSMQGLDLIDEKGMPTATFNKLRSVPEADYQATLAEWLQSVYAEVFSFVDPAKDDQVRIRDAFRTYSPHGQQDRMVSLFLALCAEAGIVDESKKSEAKQGARRVNRPASAAPSKTKTENAAIQKPAHAEAKHRDTSHLGLHPGLSGLLHSIPDARIGWTKKMRDHFIQTFGVMLDFAVPIVSEEDLMERDDDA